MTEAERKITGLTQAAASSYPGGITSVVGVLVDESGINPQTGKPNRAPSTIYGDLSPHESSKGRLKVGDKVRIQQITGNIEPLRYEAALFGYRLHPMTGNEPDAPTMFEEFFQDGKAVIRFQKVGVAYREGKASLPEFLAARDDAHAEIDQSFTRTVKGDVQP